MDQNGSPCPTLMLPPLLLTSSWCFPEWVKLNVCVSKVEVGTWITQQMDTGGVWQQHQFPHFPFPFGVPKFCFHLRTTTHIKMNIAQFVILKQDFCIRSITSTRLAKLTLGISHEGPCSSPTFSTTERGWNTLVERSARPGEKILIYVL